MLVPDKINVVVPTGNFGNILAAYYAKLMGIPVNKLICASNILVRAAARVKKLRKLCLDRVIYLISALLFQLTKPITDKTVIANDFQNKARRVRD